MTPSGRYRVKLPGRKVVHLAHQIYPATFCGIDLGERPLAHQSTAPVTCRRCLNERGAK